MWEELFHGRSSVMEELFYGKWEELFHGRSVMGGGRSCHVTLPLIFTGMVPDTATRISLLPLECTK